MKKKSLQRMKIKNHQKMRGNKQIENEKGQFESQMRKEQVN